MPAVFAATSSNATEGTLTEESVLVAIALIIGYGLSLIYQFANPSQTLGGHGEPAGHAGPMWTGRQAILVLILTAALLAVLSEILVDSITVFTDMDCQWCQRLHSQIAEYNRLGVKVRYMSWPRSGPATG